MPHRRCWIPIESLSLLSPRRRSTSSVMTDEVTTARWLDLQLLSLNRLPKSPSSSILILHVDDGFHFGDGPEYEASMNKLFEDFEIPPEKRKSGTFTFLGRTVIQLDDMSFVVSLEIYVNDIKTILIPKTRRAGASSTLTAEEKSTLMSLVG